MHKSLHYKSNQKTGKDFLSTLNEKHVEQKTLTPYQGSSAMF